MRLIFVNRFFYPDHSATSQMLTDLAFGLAEKGMDVSVIASRLRYDGSAADLAPRETINGMSVKRIWTSRFGRSVLTLRAVDYLTFYLSVTWALLRTVRRGDIVVAMTDPPAVSVIAAVVAFLRGARLINWLQDVFPEVVEALNLGRGPASFVLTPLRILRNASLRSAEMNVAIGVLMAERLQRFGVKRERTTVISNWADTDAIRPIPPERNKLRADWALTGQFVVVYSGNLGRAHDIETLLGAIAATAIRPASARQIRWIFIGGGAGFEILRRETARFDAGTVTFHPYQPREALAESLSVADVHIVSLKPELEGLIVPSKFYGIAAAGRPAVFIGCPRGEIGRLIAQYDCGGSVAIGDALALVETINAMARDPELCRAMGGRARKMCEDCFSKVRAIEVWHDLIETVVNVPNPANAGIERVATPPIENRLGA